MKGCVFHDHGKEINGKYIKGAQMECGAWRQ